MDAVDVIAVVGACGPERQRYAAQLAGQMGVACIPASDLARSSDPLGDAAARAPWHPAGAVVELPEDVPAQEIVGAFADDENGTRLLGMVCVVDAAHLFDDLHRQDYLQVQGTGSDLAPFAARAQLTVTQIEYASTIVLVGWSALKTADLAVVMAVLSHLSPRARLRLDGASLDRQAPDIAYGVEQDRAGWICLLNGDFDPHMTDPLVSAFHYEQLRPLHPERFRRLLDKRIARGEFGLVVRSAGFCRLATRPHVVAQWEHVGRVASLHPLATDNGLDDRPDDLELLTDDEELLALGQELAVVGVRLDREGLAAALDEAALTDEEFAAGPTAWAAFTDPFPVWTPAADRSE